jgi:hypothetical protein
MSTDSNSTPAPPDLKPQSLPGAGDGAARRRWQPTPQKKLPLSMIISFVVIAAVVVFGVAALLAKMARPITENTGPKLAKEITDTRNNYTIRPPMNWHVEDRHDGKNVYIKGPREKGFSPLIIVSLDIKPGGMTSYLLEHKGRISAEDKSIKWISEDTDESIDGCVNTARLEYDCDMAVDPADASKGNVTIRTLQYIMEDKPRFYRVTCHVAIDQYEAYLPRFEACVRSFKRIPLPQAPIQPLN